MGASSTTESSFRRRLAGVWRGLRANYAAYLTLLACLAITIFAWRFTSLNVQQKSREAFSVSTKIEKETVGLKVKTYLEALRGLRNFLSVTPRVSNTVWRDYIATMDPDGRFHGIHEIVYARYVRKGEREEFPVERVYPFEDAARLLGRDLGLNEKGAPSNRRKVMDQARDSGEPRALAVQFGGIREGFELVLAVYNSSPVPATVPERRRALRGFVILTFSMRELLSGVFSSGVVYSLDTSGGGDDVAYTEIVTLNIAGEKWNLYFSIPSGYSEATDRSPLFVLVGGVIFSLLLFGIIYSLSNARLRAVTMAEAMTVDLREARDIANAASRAKSDFLASMSHEIRTPMNAIIGMGELLRETPLTGEQKNYIDVYKRASETLQSLINDILDLSRIESGQLELEEIEFDLRELVESTAAMFRIRTDEKGLFLNTDLASDLPRRVLGDPTRLRQILINLVGNSIKFTETGGITMKAILHVPGTRGDSRSSVHGRDDMARILFSVNDTGIGIPADKTETIFESFSQVDSSTTRKYGGTGLGLDICRRLTEKMNGDIWVESDFGHGSTFKFTAELGIGTEPVTSEEKALPAEQIAAAEAGRSLRVLLAEDSADNRLLISAYMKNSNHVLEQAENGEEAVRMFQAGSYDIILMDVQMPIMDGYQATRRIRELEKEQGLERTVIVALTAHALTEYVEESRKAGCDDHLTKPIKKQVLLDALDNAAASIPS